MTGFPESWTTETLGTITSRTRPICYGVLKPGSFDADGVPLLRIQDLAGNRVVAGDGIHFISKQLDEEFRRSRLVGGEVLLSIQGTIGRTAIVPSRLAGANISRTLALIQPDESLIPKFLYFYFQHLVGRHGYETGGTTRASLNISTIRNMEVPIPPSAEQQRIVDAIEEQFSRVDAGVAALERVRRNLKRLRTAVLQAVMPFATDEVPKVPLEDLVQLGRKIAYGVLVPGDHVADGVPLVRVGDLSNRQVNSPGLKRIAPAVAAQFPRTRLHGGEVLLSIVGTIGRTAVVPPSLKGANAARALAVIPVRETVDPGYVAIALSCPGVTRELTELSHEVARKTLNLEDIRRYRIPLPNHTEQLEIVKAVDNAETWIASVENMAAHTVRRAEHLRFSILGTAFSGKLVLQDPSDEPSSVLLERIAFEQVSSNGKGRARIREPHGQREKTRT